jgi:uncharacterized iron-regulated protein
MHFLFILLLSACAQSQVRIHELRGQRVLTPAELALELPSEGIIVLSEKHFTSPIQNAQGSLIRQVVETQQARGKFTVAWEFLDFSEQSTVDRALEQWREQSISEQEFMIRLFTTPEAAKKNQSYLPVLRAVRDLNGQLLAVNAPRSWKRQITTGGLAALEPDKLPAHCPAGSEAYWERFQQAMQGHASVESMQRFFEAQYYTDCVIAATVRENSQYPLRFLLIGSFHADYLDGVVPLLERPVTIKLTNDSHPERLLIPHPSYGMVADFLYVIP